MHEGPAQAMPHPNMPRAQQYAKEYNMRQISICPFVFLYVHLCFWGDLVLIQLLLFSNQYMSVCILICSFVFGYVRLCLLVFVCARQCLFVSVYKLSEWLWTNKNKLNSLMNEYIHKVSFGKVFMNRLLVRRSLTSEHEQEIVQIGSFIHNQQGQFSNKHLSLSYFLD